MVSPTTDHELVKRNLQNIILGPRTAIGEAVFASLGAIASVPTAPGQTPPPARIVLMSDGETTVGRSNELAAAGRRRRQGPRLHHRLRHRRGLRRGRGPQHPRPREPRRAAQLAEQTDGSAFEAATAKELRKVYADIGSSVGYRTEKREITSWFVGLGLFFGLAAAASSLVWFSRLP